MRAQLTRSTSASSRSKRARVNTAQNPNLDPLNIALSDPSMRAEVHQMLDFLNTLQTQNTRVFTRRAKKNPPVRGEAGRRVFL